MYGNAVSQALKGEHARLAAAQIYLDQARQQKKELRLDVALILYDQAKATFKNIANAHKIPTLSELKELFVDAQTSQTVEENTFRENTFRQRIGEVYFERAKLLDELDPGKAEASRKKAQVWGYEEYKSSSMSSYIASSAAPALNLRSSVKAQSALSPAEKNTWVDDFFSRALDAIKSLNRCNALHLSHPSPSFFLVYAHDIGSSTYGSADASTSQYFIQKLFEVRLNLYSDQTPMGQPETGFSTPEAHRNIDDILTAQLCLLPMNIGMSRPVDKVIVCCSEVLEHYLEGEYYTAYYKALDVAYDAAYKQQNDQPIREVVKRFSEQEELKDQFHHVLTEIAFLQIRASKRQADRHGIIPVSLTENSYERCFKHFVETTAVRIQDISRFKAKELKGEEVYANQGRHWVLFKLLERFLVHNEKAKIFLDKFWAGYAKLAAHLKAHPHPATEKCLSIAKETFQEIEQTLLNTLCDTVERQQRYTFVDLKTLQTALKASYSMERVSIQRLSGQTLPMDHCYINLAVVERTKSDKKDQKNANDVSAKKMKTPHRAFFHRLPSSDAVNTNLDKQVVLEKLFDPGVASGGRQTVPKRILIRGRAGAGKTTLSKKIVYEYTQSGMWRSQFDWLLWISLRKLKGKSSADLETLFYEEYFHTHPLGRGLARTLCEQVNGAAKDKTLFVLDGWDEVAQEWDSAHPMAIFLKNLLNQTAVIVTSRPQVDLQEIRPMDLELETLGFSSENVEVYLNNSDIVPPAHAEAIRNLMRDNPFVQELVNVPIQLDTLVFSWDEIRQMQQVSITITALYQAMTNKLWRKDILRLQKQVDGKVLTESIVNALRTTARIEHPIKAEKAFLCNLAFKGLEENYIEFQLPYLDDLIAQVVDGGLSLPLTLEEDLTKLSFLQMEGIDKDEAQRSYSFRHKTFQEFFAARYFAQHWETAQSLLMLHPLSKQWVKVTPEKFLEQRKYDPHYEIMWWFVAGFLRGNALNYFFEMLEAEPYDLLGVYHQRLIINCLHEADRGSMFGLNRTIRKRLEQRFKQWLELEIKTRGECTLAELPICPEHLLRVFLQRTASIESKQAIARACRKRSALSQDILDDLLAIIKEDINVAKRAAAVALSRQTSLPEGTLKNLIIFIKEEDMLVKEVAADALSGQRALPDAILENLRALIKDGDSLVKQAVAKVLGHQTTLSKAAMHDLIALINDENDEVKRVATIALGRQPFLPEDTLKQLIDLIKNQNNDVKWAASDTLGHQLSLPETATEYLITLLENENNVVKEAAARALNHQHQSALPETALEGLIALIKDGNNPAKRAASDILGHQISLRIDSLQGLLTLIKSGNSRVREAAAEALGRQTTLPPAILEELRALIKNKNKGAQGAAAHALGRQTTLPENALNDLRSTANEEKIFEKRAAARTFGLQTTTSPIKVTKGLRTPTRHENNSAAEQAPGSQSALPGAVPKDLDLIKEDGRVSETRLKGLIVLLQDQERVLETQGGPLAIYHIMPTINQQHVELLYETYLLKVQRFNQIAPFYIEGDLLCFYTSKGFQTKQFASSDQIIEFRETLQKVQQKLGILLNTAQEKAWSTASTQKNQFGISVVDQATQTGS